MERYQREPEIYENVEIIDAGSEGKAVARVNNLVVFVSHVVPGDIVDIQIVKKKKSFIEGKAIKFHKYSEKRAEVSCSHFGVCGGCKWQNMDYLEQLFYKQKQVEDNLKRIGKIDVSSIMPIIPSENTFYYRNKLEYTFSCKRWLLDDEIKTDELIANSNALGFHIPLLFDRVVDITKCYLQKEPSNAIRYEVNKYALEYYLSFFDA